VAVPTTEKAGHETLAATNPHPARNRVLLHGLVAARGPIIEAILNEYGEALQMVFSPRQQLA
jgi:hypothetical protein